MPIVHPAPGQSVRKPISLAMAERTIREVNERRLHVLAYYRRIAWAVLAVGVLALWRTTPDFQDNISVLLVSFAATFLLVSVFCVAALHRPQQMPTGADHHDLVEEFKKNCLDEESACRMLEAQAGAVDVSTNSTTRAKQMCYISVAVTVMALVLLFSAQWKGGVMQDSDNPAPPPESAPEPVQPNTTLPVAQGDSVEAGKAVPEGSVARIRHLDA